jgi:hypothetical protein
MSFGWCSNQNKEEVVDKSDGIPMPRMLQGVEECEIFDNLTQITDLLSLEFGWEKRLQTMMNGLWILLQNSTKMVGICCELQGKFVEPHHSCHSWIQTHRILSTFVSKILKNTLPSPHNTRQSEAWTPAPARHGPLLEEVK